MNKLGNKLRELREAQGLLLRQVAAYLETDTAHISKIEHGERKPRREQVIQLAGLLNINSDELLTLWLADQVLYLVQDEDVALSAMRVAEEEVKYQKRNSQ